MGMSNGLRRGLQVLAVFIAFHILILMLVPFQMKLMEA